MSSQQPRADRARRPTTVPVSVQLLNQNYLELTEPLPMIIGHL